MTKKKTASSQHKVQLYDDLDTLFLASQLYSYPGRYLKENPSTDRIAETLLKIEEDVLGETNYPVPRSAKVILDKPINAKKFLEERSLTPKNGVRAMTEHLRERIEVLLNSVQEE